MKTSQDNLSSTGGEAGGDLFQDRLIRRSFRQISSELSVKPSKAQKSVHPLAGGLLNLGT
jgi:hypothetical protein